MAEQRDYSGELPLRPPEDMEEWLYAQGAMDGGYLIYTVQHQKKGIVKITCTECGNSEVVRRINGNDTRWRMPYFGFEHPGTGESAQNGECALCPMCEAPVTVVYCGDVSSAGRIGWNAWPMTVHRLEDNLVLIGWCVQKLFFPSGRTELNIYKHEAFVIEKSKIIRLTAHTTFINTIRHNEQWRQLKRYSDTWGEVRYVYPWNKKLLNGSVAENCKLDIFLKNAKKNPVTPVSYMRLWQMHPNAENLIMQGGVKMLAAALDDERTSMNSYYRTAPAVAKLNWIDWKKSKPHEMMRMTRPEYNALIRNKSVDAFTLKFRLEEIAAGRSMPVNEMEMLNFLGVTNCLEMRNHGEDWITVAKYLKKQKAKDKRSDVHTLRDYWRIARQIGEDMALPIIKFPPNLMRAHDRVEGVRRWRAEAEKQAERDARAHLFDEVYEKLLPLAWEHDGIIIRPARNEDELIREGKELSHCVGSYVQTHIGGNKPIFFIRRADEPEKPWYTLQLNVKALTVIQNRGLRNCERTGEITVFEKAWLEHIREVAPREKKKPRKRAVKADAAAGAA